MKRIIAAVLAALALAVVLLALWLAAGPTADSSAVYRGHMRPTHGQLGPPKTGVVWWCQP